MDRTDIPARCCLGLLGYGKVGRILTEHLRGRGVARIVACGVAFGAASAPTEREIHAVPEDARLA